jgi:hypothetical protein
MALLLGVHLNTYRSWETGTGERDGPTHDAALRLDRILKARLGDAYEAGDVLRVWGWPLEAELNFEELQRTLRDAGFHFVDVEWRTPPGMVLWVHRLRDPNIVHGVFALAAAACTRAGLDVRLLLDDTHVANRIHHRDQQRATLESCIKRWFAFAQGDIDRLSSALYSEIVAEHAAAERAWWSVNDYLNADGNNLVDYLVASKAISPTQYEDNPDAGLAPLVHQNPPIGTKLLLTPLWNWVVFEIEIRRLLRAGTDDDDGAAIVTLGGEDERILWDMWHNGCADEIGTRVKHIYLRTMPVPSQPWNLRPLALPVARRELINFLRSRTQDGDSDLITWFQAAAVALPAALNEEFKQMLPPYLTTPTTFRRVDREGQLPLIEGITSAVERWF